MFDIKIDFCDAEREYFLEKKAMKLSTEDQQLLAELCSQNNVSREKVTRLLQTVHEYEFKERRTGVYDALREILKSSPAAE